MSQTIWGPSLCEKTVAQGITHYKTATGGGYHLSPERLGAMPQPYRSIPPLYGEGWYDDECDWAIVAVAFPDCFSAGQVVKALTWFSHFLLRRLPFDVAYMQLAALGYCDAPGGMEYKRLSREWHDAGTPDDVFGFIICAANIGPHGLCIDERELKAMRSNPADALPGIAALFSSN